MKRGLRLLIWPGSLILFVALLFAIDVTMIVLASRTSDGPPAVTAPDETRTEEPAP